jgi:adenylate cyclase
MTRTLVERTRSTPISGEAFDHWMRGRYLMWTLKTREQLALAREHFEAARLVEPRSAAALSGLAFTHLSDVIYRWSADPKQSLALARSFAQQAVEIDPNNQAALKAMGGVQMFAGELADAASTTRRLLALNPNDAHSNRDLAATLYFQGQWEEALRQLAVAERLNPLEDSHMWKVHSMATVALIALHRYDEAIERGRRNLTIHPTPANSLSLLAAAEAHRGNLVEAKALVAEVLLRDPRFVIGGTRGWRGSTAPAFLEGQAHIDGGLRLAGLPEARVAAASAPDNGR